MRSSVSGSAGISGSWKWRTSKRSRSMISLTRLARWKLSVILATESFIGSEKTRPIR